MMNAVIVIKMYILNMKYKKDAFSLCKKWFNYFGITKGKKIMV